MKFGGSGILYFLRLRLAATVFTSSSIKKDQITLVNNFRVNENHTSFYNNKVVFFIPFFVIDSLFDPIQVEALDITKFRHASFGIDGHFSNGFIKVVLANQFDIKSFFKLNFEAAS